MKAVTWHGKRDVRVDTVPDPKIEEPTDAIIEVTSTNICGSDLHLYEILGAFMNPGDILGHEPMGIVREVGSRSHQSGGGRPGGHPIPDLLRQLLHVRSAALHPVRDDPGPRPGMGAALFGYSELYGAVPGGQAELLRVPQAQFTHIKVPDGPPDSRFVYLSDVLPTAWQSVAYADIPDGVGDRSGSRTDRRHGGPHRSTTSAIRSSPSTGCPSGSRGRRPAACTRSTSTNTTTTSATSSAT